MAKQRNARDSRAYREARRKCLSVRPLICAWCGEDINPALRHPHPMSATADHVVPIASGGHMLGRLQPMHKSCNEAKSDVGHVDGNPLVEARNPFGW